MCMKIYMYRKKDENLTEIEKILDQPYELYIALDCDSSIFQRLKQDIEWEPGLLILSSISSIGVNKHEIVDELLWLYNRHIPTVVADLPATWVWGDLAASELVLRVLIDVYSSDVNLSDDKKVEITVPTSIGQKKVVFPENWEELYNKWSSGAITSKEFIERSGLKKGTFFNLINEYRALR